MRFSTTRFEWAHGRKPRGFGGWAFDFFGDRGEQLGETFFASPGSFTHAKAEAKAEGKRRGARDFELGS